MARRTLKADAPDKPSKAKGKAAPASDAPVESPDGAENSADSKGKKLVVVESPAKAKTINRYLGRNYIVKASMGHVRDLPAKEMGVDVEHGFAPSYEPLAGRRKVLAELKKAAKGASEVFLATDLDREGEAIAWHLAESLGVPASRIHRVIFNEITKTAIQAAFEHPRSIDMNKVNAQQARRILDRIVGYEISPLLWRKVATGLSAGRVQSVAVRLVVDREREIDAFMPEEYWKIGAIFTTDIARQSEIAQKWSEFLAKRDENNNPPTKDAQQDLLSAIGAFRAELVSWRGEKFKSDNSEQSLEIVKALGLTIKEVRRVEDPKGKGPAKNVVTVIGHVGPGPAFSVRSINLRESRTKPLPPLTTAALQQAASVQLRFGAQRTMRIAQQLYEGIDVPGEGSVGLITYMRTDSTQLSKEAIGQVRSLIGQQFGPAYLPASPNVYSSSERAQEAHEAIRATDATRTPQSLMAALTDEQYKLYDLIWKRFVACQMTPAVWNVTEADIVADVAQADAGAGASCQAVFKAMGRSLAFDGFLRVTGLPKTGDQLLPSLAQSQPLAPVSLSPTQHFTQPPPRYTEASLVKAMEADNIGRPSTYATIIQTIQDRQYAELLDRTFRPTDLGIAVTDKLVKHFPKEFDVRFTAHMENELDKVEDATADWVSVLTEFYGPFHKTLETAAKEMVHAKAESTPSDYKCDTCGKPMAYRFSKTGRYLSCTGYPDCKQTNPVDKEGKKVERREVDVICPLCNTRKMMLRRSRFGPFLGCTGYPECKGTMPCDDAGSPIKTIKPEEVPPMACPECSAPMAVRFKGRRAFMGCTRYPDCKTAANMPDGVRVQAPPRPEPKKAEVRCPKCGRDMLIRDGKRGEFIACSGFPKCRNAMNLDKLDELKAEQAKNPIAPPAEKGKSTKKKSPKAAKATKTPQE